MATYLDAAAIILKDAARPLSQEEITHRAIDRGLIVPGGPTPERSMGSLIYVDIRNCGEHSRFLQIGKNQFMLRGSSEVVVLHDIKTAKPPYKPMEIKPSEVSYRKAAQIVLKEAGHPLTVGEILQNAIELGLLNPEGGTPERSMNSRIVTEIQQHGENSIFIRVDRGLYFLRDTILVAELISYTPQKTEGLNF